MIRAVVWRAVSSKQQAKDDKISLEVQYDQCLAKLTELGATLVETLTVPGHSRDYVLFEDAARDMPAYADLRRLVEGRSIDLLLYYTKSRLGRTLALCEAVVGLCQVNGVAVYDLSAPPSTLDARQQRRSNGDVLISAVTSAQSQNDNSNRTVAHESGMIARVQAGKMPSGIPFGYRKNYTEDGSYKIVVHEDEAETIRLTFQFYLSGNGMDGVANLLNERNRTTPAGVAFTRSSVERIIARVWIYGGYVEINRTSKKRQHVRSKGNHPAIIAEETVQRVVRERAERLKARRAINTKHLFSRVVKCGSCVHKMIVDNLHGRYVTQSGKVNYHCPSLACRRCGRVVSQNVIRNKIIIWFDRVAQGDYKIAVATESDVANLEKRITQVETQQKEAAKRLSRAHTAYVDGNMPYDTYTAQVKRLGHEQARATSELNDTRAQLVAMHTRQARSEKLIDIAATGRSMLDHADKATANAWLREYFEMEFTEDRMLVIRLK